MMLTTPRKIPQHYRSDACEATIFVGWSPSLSHRNKHDVDGKTPGCAFVILADWSKIGARSKPSRGWVVPLAHTSKMTPRRALRRGAAKQSNPRVCSGPSKCQRAKG